MARAVGIPVTRRLGGRLATKNVIILFFSLVFSPSIATFSHRRSTQTKKLIEQKLTGAPKNLGVDSVPILGLMTAIFDFEVLIEGMIESENLFSES